MCEYVMGKLLETSPFLVIRAERNGIQSFLVVFENSLQRNHLKEHWNQGEEGHEFKVFIPLVEYECHDVCHSIPRKPWQEKEVGVKNQPKLFLNDVQAQMEIDILSAWGARNWYRVSEMGLYVSEINKKAFGIIAHSKVKIEFLLEKETGEEIEVQHILQEL